MCVNSQRHGEKEEWILMIIVNEREDNEKKVHALLEDKHFC